MLRNIKRSYRRFQQNLLSQWSSRQSSQARYFIAGFVVIGILAFASLHTVLNVMATTNSYTEVGYFDLYGENLTSCWGSAFVGRQTTSSWPSVVQLPTPPTTITSNSQAHSPNEASDGSSIRKTLRNVYSWNHSTFSGDYHYIQAGDCIQQQSLFSFLRAFSKEKMYCLPSFMIVGAMKSGTGELMKWLELHPYLKVIRGAGGKRESHFFTRGLDTSPNAAKPTQRAALLMNYTKYLPLFSEEQARSVYTFEKSPDYMRDKTTMKLLHSSLPNLRIIIILRNPAHRAVSEFYHHCRHHRYIKLLDAIQVPSHISHMNLSIPSLKKRHESQPTVPQHSYPAGSILRVIDESNSYLMAGSLPLYVVDITTIPSTSYIRLKTPCSTDDMVAFFTQQGAQETTDTKKLHRRLAGNATIEVSKQVDFREEMRNGFYDEHLYHVFKIFHPSRVLILLQEDMFRNTYRTLRRVESFLGVPCYDYSQAAYSPDMDSPPIRRPSTVLGKLQLYLRTLAQVFVGGGQTGSSLHNSGDQQYIHASQPERHGDTSSPPTSSKVNVHGNRKRKAQVSSTELLLRKTSKSFQSWLNTVYAPHNRDLQALLDSNFGPDVVPNTMLASNRTGTHRDSIVDTKDRSLKQPEIDLVGARWNFEL